MRPFILIFALQFLPTDLIAQDIGHIRNADAQACSDYIRFLGYDAGDSSDQCSHFEQFVIFSASSGAEFLESFQRQFGADSVIGTLALSLSEYGSGEPARAFVALDLADRGHYSAMNERGDLGRAGIYSVVISSFKADLLREICAGGADVRTCSVDSGFADAADLSDNLGYLDDVPAARALFCLLRTDGYTVPITDVVLSPRFLGCVAEGTSY